MSCKTKKKPQTIAELEYEITAKLGEGAFWDYHKNILYWVDIENQTLHIYTPNTKTNKELKMPSRIGTVVPSEEKNQVVVALEDGIYMVNTITEKINLLSDIEANNDENRFNDGKCDPNGNLWVGSMHLTQTHPNANLYKIDEFGNAYTMKDSVTISNGIVWTKDKKQCTILVHLQEISMHTILMLLPVLFQMKELL